MKKEKLLIITYYWPPAGGAGVQRWLKFVKYLAKSNKFEIFVYTVKNPEAPEDDNSLLKDIPENITVFKKKIKEPLSLYKKITGQKRISAGFLNEKKSKKNSIVQKISIFIRGNFFIPDAKMFWINPSVKYLSNLIKKQNIDKIITTGPPHSVNVIGLKLNRKFPHLQWIADFRDPWTNIDFYKELNLSKFADKKHHKLEKQVLQTADKVITVGNTLANELKEISNKNNVFVITNGYDTTDFELFKKQKTDKFIIAHIGSINKDRNHESFYKAIKYILNNNTELAKKLELVFVGKLDASVIDLLEKYEIINYCKIINYLPHNEAVQYMFNADLLYLPINNSPNAKGILTGKFFEYLATKNPILAIGPTNGDIANILAETNSGQIFDFNNYEGIIQFISNIDKKTFSFKNIEKYSREKLTERLMEILNE